MPNEPSDSPMRSVSTSTSSGRPQRPGTTDTRALTLLANGIAHDMSEVLRSLKGHLQVSRDDLPEDHVVQGYLDQALVGLRDAEALVERLRALSRDGTADVRASVDLVAIVKEILSLAESSFPSGCTLRTRFDAACSVPGRPAQLQRLVADLVTRAGARMEGQWEERPTVLDVSVQRVAADPDLADQYLNVEPGPYVHLAVSNTAEGGTPREAGESGTTVEVGADGLHGSEAHDIVAAHGGSMTVRDEPGEGTTFNVYLPCGAADESPSLEAPDASPEDSAQHVLVVDDDETVRTLEGVRLSRLGHEVTRAADAESALAAVKEAPDAFDIALIDYHMPEMNGLELVHALRGEGGTAAVVLMTGLSAQISEAKARVVGIDHLLRKPVERQELREVLAQLG